MSLSANASSLVTSHITALFLQSVFYGIYIVTCGFLAAVLTRTSTSGHACTARWRTLAEINWILLVASVFLLLNTTLNTILGVYRLVMLLAYQVLAQDSSLSWVYTAKPVNLLVQSTICDLVLIYRTYIVYFKKWVIVMPSIVLWLAGTLCGCLSLGSTAREVPYDMKKYTISFWSLSVGQHLITTGLLISKLWRVDQSLRISCKEPQSTSVFRLPRLFREDETSLQRVIRTVAESGALYTISAISVLCALATETIAMYPITSVELIVVGISFNLIIIRCNHDSEKERYQNAQFTRSLHFNSMPARAEKSDSELPGSAAQDCELDPRSGHPAESDHERDSATWSS